MTRPSSGLANHKPAAMLPALPSAVRFLSRLRDMVGLSVLKAGQVSYRAQPCVGDVLELMVGLHFTCRKIEVYRNCDTLSPGALCAVDSHLMRLNPCNKPP